MLGGPWRFSRGEAHPTLSLGVTSLLFSHLPSQIYRTKSRGRGPTLTDFASCHRQGAHSAFPSRFRPIFVVATRGVREMTSLTPQRCLVVSVLALTVSILGMSAAARAQGQSGTTLSVAKTATGFYERRIPYTWTLNKSVTPPTRRDRFGRDPTGHLFDKRNSTLSPPIDIFGVRGDYLRDQRRRL